MPDQEKIFINSEGGNEKAFSERHAKPIVNFTFNCYWIRKNEPAPESSRKIQYKEPERSVMSKQEIENELYELIRIFILRRVRSRDKAADLTQEVFLRLMNQIPPVVREKIRAWLYRTARNLITDSSRHDERTKTVAENLIYLRQKRSEPDLQTVLERNEEQKMILDLMNELDSDHREVLRLKFQEDLSYQEMADVLDKPKTTVAWLLHESILRLREKVKVAK